MIKDFKPLCDFEQKLTLAQNGKISMPDLLQSFVVAELVVPSATEVVEDGSGLQPLLFPKNEVQMVGCFSDKERIGDFATMVPYYLLMKGKDLLRRLPVGYGLVVNPGQAVGFDISPEGIARVLEEFSN
ncbi:SseB family protein [Neisseriaceae bacterium TC5R-5]|nr:SseB family protein [Neisseriaceae bacterium TC5R-5]